MEKYLYTLKQRMLQSGNVAAKLLTGNGLAIHEHITLGLALRGDPLSCGQCPHQVKQSLK